MKIGLQTWGSDGDIRPFIALAGGLSKRGHEVTLHAFSLDGKDYSDLAQALDFKIIGMQKDSDLSTLAKKIRQTNNPLNQIKLLFSYTFFPYQDELFAVAMQLCKENDLVIGHHILTPLKAAAEKTGRDHCSVFLCHSLFPSKYLSPDPFPNFGSLANMLLWKISDFSLNFMLKKDVNSLREKNGLSPIKSVLQSWQSESLNLIAVTSSLCQKQPDWTDNIHVCGFFDIPLVAEKWEQPPELKAFLEAGEPPVYYTFGSMTQFSVEEATKLMLNAARLSGKRAIIQSHWDQVKDIPEEENIFRVSKLPHHHIFPLCAVVVHHGGAGTTHSATRSGAASVVVKYAFDQGFWGKELKRIGVGGKVLNRRDVTANTLAEQVRAVYESIEIRQKSQAIGEIMRAEKGINRAVQLIENQYFQKKYEVRA